MVTVPVWIKRCEYNAGRGDWLLRAIRYLSKPDIPTTALRQQRPFPHRMLWNGSSQLLVQQLKEVAYSFERLRIAIADIDHAIAFAL